ncbi:STY4526/YPO1902 family pathogenicity island replication protein [Solimonas sp. SE-A11]|uniref:STY4526/YPO1902 family pathogenicity island replication protein n=1 Tax=Solimonas sp. SE-A11 TaxID=3054954 RepID=UPI00259CB5D0|nr:STY4526/YPO1902 family pathogenicity island replication protein [Solimonas sp. SE-A11]MDM4770854.1 STY4526/YPO1902 family pathogenicity island replication protein [Solimonas sp. SE-A11]
MSAIPQKDERISSTDRTKEADLVFAVFQYASRCVVEGDLLSLREVGFTPADVHRFEKLSLPDLYALSMTRGHPLSVTVDREVWEWLVEHVQRTRARSQLISDIIRLDAPLSMMKSVFGFSQREYMARREACDMSDGRGRPRAPTAEEEERIWPIWVRLAKASDPQHLRKDDLWRILPAVTGIPLRTIWNLIQSWAHTPAMLSRFEQERRQLKDLHLEAFEAGLRSSFEQRPERLA